MFKVRLSKGARVVIDMRTVSGFNIGFITDMIGQRLVKPILPLALSQRFTMNATRQDLHMYMVSLCY